MAVEEVIDAGERVFLTAHHRGRGRGSGMENDARLYSVYTLRGGKVVRDAVVHTLPLSDVRALASVTGGA